MSLFIQVQLKALFNPGLKDHENYMELLIKHLWYHARVLKMEIQRILENSEDPKKIQFESLNVCEMYPMILILNLLCKV